MNNKYISKLTDEDIAEILKKCGFSLAKSFKNHLDDLIEPIERFDNKADKIMVRCITPNVLDEFASIFVNTINNSNPNLATKIIGSSAILNSATSNNKQKDINILIIEDYIAYFPMEEDDNCKNTMKIHQEYITYCAEKFGEEYIKDYVESRKKLLEENKSANNADL